MRSNNIEINDDSNLQNINFFVNQLNYQTWQPFLAACNMTILPKGESIMYITDSIQPLYKQYAFLSVIRLQDDDGYNEWDDDDEAFDEEDENWEYDDDEEFVESDDEDEDIDPTGRALDVNPYGEPDD